MAQTEIHVAQLNREKRWSAVHGALHQLGIANHTGSIACKFVGTDAWCTGPSIDQRGICKTMFQFQFQRWQESLGGIALIWA